MSDCQFVLLRTFLQHRLGSLCSQLQLGSFYRELWLRGQRLSKGGKVEAGRSIDGVSHIPLSLTKDGICWA